jgi:cation diffusion facilitator family transporter
VSGSLVLISSAVDSLLDLATGTAMFFATREKQRGVTASYPIGRARSEPVTVVALATVMGLAGVLLIRESITGLVAGAAAGVPPQVDVGVFSFLTLAVTIAVKVSIYVMCAVAAHFSSSGASAALSAIGVDSLNDCVSNVFALVALGIYVADARLWWIDPGFASLMGLFILGRWIVEGLENAKKLVGTAAARDIVAEVARIVFFHDARIRALDTIRAYHVGERLFLEVDIQLSPSITLREAHDIGEALQLRLEHAADVERAFVHLDFESEHNPANEHVKPDDDGGRLMLEAGDAIPGKPTAASSIVLDWVVGAAAEGGVEAGGADAEGADAEGALQGAGAAGASGTSTENTPSSDAQ